MKEEAGDVADSQGGETIEANGRGRPRFLSALSALSAVLFPGLENAVTRRLESQRYGAKEEAGGSVFSSAAAERTQWQSPAPDR